MAASPDTRVERSLQSEDDVRWFLETIDRMHDLHVIARALVDGLRQGRHATPQRGGSTEFFDYRMYVPGDDVRRIDWKLYGRSDRLYVRRHRRFADLTGQLIVDCSASMAFTGRSGVSKYRYASMLAAAMAMVTVRQGDRAGLALAGERLVSALPPGGTLEHLHRVIHLLEETRPQGETRLPDGLLAAQQLIPRRRVVVILSDLLVEPAELRRSLHPIAHQGCDVVAVQILTPEELNLRGLGGGQFVDEETGLAVRSHAPTVMRDYERILRGHIETLRHDFNARGMGFHTAMTTDSPVETLRRVLRLGGLGG